MRTYPGVLLALVCLLQTTAAHAQADAPTPVLTPPPGIASSSSGPVVSVASGDPTSNSLHEGVWSLAFQLPTGGSPWLDNSLGAWYMLTPRINLGLNLNLTIDPEQGGRVTTVVGGNAVTTTDTYVNVTFIVAPALKYYFTTSGPVAPFAVGQLQVGLARGNANGAGDTAGVLSLMGGFGLEVFPWRFLSFGGQIGLQLDLLRPGAAARSAALETLTSAIYATVYFE